MRVKRSIACVRLRALQTTAVAITMLAANQAQAQCAPDPTQTNGTTTCSGTDTNGLSVTTSGTKVVVPSGATVQGSDAAAITVQPYNSVSISISGRVDGGSNPGIVANTSNSIYSLPTLTVAQGAVVTGTNAVLIGTPGIAVGSIVMSIDNAGTLSGTSGIALATASPLILNYSISNRAAGAIGAISAFVGSLSNAGTIDGGSLSAVDLLSSSTSYQNTYAQLTNTGTITASSSTATIANAPQTYVVSNSGKITNLGSGAAFTGGNLTIANAAGGQISSVGSVAIQASGVTLTNAGTITGDVVATQAQSQSGMSGSTVDSTAGTIQGNVTFGAGDDTLVARYSASTGVVTGVTGTIDGGAGTDTLRLALSADTTINTAVVLPTNFERLAINPASGTTTTLAAGFSVNGGVAAVGTDPSTGILGKVVNNGTLTGTTQALLVGTGGYTGVNFVNAGTIAATGGQVGTPAVLLNAFDNYFENDGTITSAGDGVQNVNQGSVLNTGSITAVGTGVTLASLLTNSGSITSTGGIGVVTSYGILNNSGTIQGATVGVQTNSQITNSGTISSAGTAIAISVGSNLTLINKAGGVVTGSAAAIGSVSTTSSAFSAVVSNAGTINGDVGSTTTSGFSASYYALPGGVLNGNLALGNGGTLVTELTNTGTGAFAGIKGTVTATNGTLRYRARGTSSATLSAPAGFASVGYDLYDGAALTLTGVGSSTSPLLLAGLGSVDLTANIATTDKAAINFTTVLVGAGETAPSAAGLSVISRGALTVTRSSSSASINGAVNSSDIQSFTNAGSLTVTDQLAGAAPTIAAIYSGKTVVNSGTITLDGAIGVASATAFTNAGSVRQVSGGRTSVGVSNVQTLTNSGTINVAGPAVLIGFNRTTLVNSGAITSTADVAITPITPNSVSSLTLTNQAGGVIAGGTGKAAIQVSTGTIANAGAILGSVDLGYLAGGQRSSFTSTYTATGGTIAGDLTFGSGNDTFLEMNGASGVSGTIDGGAGTDTYAHVRTTSGTVALLTSNLVNFEVQSVRAIGSTTVATLTATAPLTTDLSLAGTGQIVNTATLNGRVLAGASSADSTASSGTLAAFTNQGTVSGGFLGQLPSLSNSGTIGSATLTTSAIYINQTGAVTFGNSGTILDNNGTNPAVSLTSAASIGSTNTGTITGGLTALSNSTSAASPQTSLVNSGTITASNTYAVKMSTVGFGTSFATMLNNSGTIQSNGSGNAAVIAQAVNDGYTVTSAQQTVGITNSGTIRVDGTAAGISSAQGPNSGQPSTQPASALSISTAPGGTATVNNMAGGLLEATGPTPSTIYVTNAALNLTNAGTIRGGAGLTLAASDQRATALGTTYLAGAIQTVGSANNTILNTGTITGSIALGAGNDSIQNYGSITGNVFLGAGNDTFLQLASATLVGTVDGGAGTDTLLVDGSNGGTINGNQFVNFETLTQTQGNVTYAGAFGVNTINVAAGTALVAAGTTVSTAGANTFTGAGGVTNNGTIAGSIALDNTSGSGVVVTNNGAITGSVSLGSGSDTFIGLDGASSVGGTIDGGAGNDTYIHLRQTTGTVTFGAANLLNFEREGVRVLGGSTVATIVAAGPIAGNVPISGDGNVVNTATLTGNVVLGAQNSTIANGGDPTAPKSLTLASFANQGTIAGTVYGTATSINNQGALTGGFSGIAQTFVNSGTIGSATLSRTAITLNGGALAFTNSGTIIGAQSSVPTAQVSGSSGTVVTNTGQITNGLEATILPATLLAEPAASLQLNNSGTINSVGSANGPAAWLRFGISAAAPIGGTIQVSNAGSITASGTATGGGATGLEVDLGNTTLASSFTIANSGTIAASSTTPSGGTARQTTALLVDGNASNTTGTITNMAGATISATGGRAFAVLVGDAPLTLTNAGTIRAAGDTTSVAIETFDAYSNTIVNSGTITGDILLADGADTIDNSGTITGKVSLGAGDDTFIERATGIVNGTVDGGAGTDTLIVDATGGGTINGSQFVNFERFSQTGSGNVTYSGGFGFDTIGLMGGTLTVAAGQTLSSTGSTTITGSSGNETVTNNGTIAGSVSLGAGNDTVVNNGTIAGSVLLGDGNDTFVEGVGSKVAGVVDGGAGTDLYQVVLAGNRTGIGQRSNFEQLGVTGSGTLTLGLDQSFQTITLTGTNLALTLNGNTVGAIDATAGAGRVSVDGDVGAVTFGAGNDTLAIGAATLAGRYDGGGGSNALQLTNTGPVTLAGTAVNFQTVSLTGNALTITGTLGSAGTPLSFGAGNQQLTVANGGTLAGTIDLGDGNDSLTLAAGSTLNGAVSGGAGTDIVTIGVAGTRSIDGNALLNFEQLATTGTGALTLTGAHNYALVTSATDLTVAAGGSLTANQVTFGPADNRFTIAGQFTGSVDGGAGSDTIAVSGGTATAPVAFGSITNVEAYTQSGGFATISGNAGLGTATLTGGRLVGLAGSTITGSTITVGQGATFGSAGTVNANVAVAGTLSPGASPGTMTVNGNVSLGATSVSLFELTPTISDRLLVNGALTIASGATLQLVPIGTLTPGQSYQLITASGGITGSFTNVLKPSSLFGVLVQRANTIDLLGQFVDNGTYTPQVSRSIAYANATLTVQPATSTLFAALPALLTATGATNPQAFAQLTPEPYASATQTAVDDALTIAQAVRSPALAGSGTTAHAYTFAQALGGWHRLEDHPVSGTAAARNRSYGFLGGIGYGDAAWSIGGYGGYLNDRQQIDALGAQTKTDGWLAGIAGRYRAAGGLGIAASVSYAHGNARTQRALPGGGTAIGRYPLKTWIGDATLSYDMAVSAGWSVQPNVGVTYLRTTRDATTEDGSSPFALSVARDRHKAGFVDAGLRFGRSDTSEAAFRPFVSFGVQYQFEGRRTTALAGYAGGGLGLTAFGAPRTDLVGTVAGGLGYRLKSGLELFVTGSSQTGNNDNQENVSGGVKLRF